MFKWRKIYWLVPVTALVIGIMWLVLSNAVYQTTNVFSVRSIDTTKYSRDLAGQMLDKPAFDTVINQQVSEIAQTGANYVAIDTPYDEQYIPFLKRWVTAARANNLHIWFRGNFSGWEGWFGFQKIDRSAHQRLLHDFITKNPDLFQDGDIFTPCPECENGGPGDPRQTGDVTGFRNFMVSEYQISQQDFGGIGKKITANYDSMNFDIAKLVMDKNTTSQMGGVVTIDHYTSDPNNLNNAVNQMANLSGGQVVLGEFGAPIPDLNGNLTEEGQASWIDQALQSLSQNPNLIGANYWTSVGGSTALWDDSGNPKKAVAIIQKFFNLQKKTSSTY